MNRNKSRSRRTVNGNDKAWETRRSLIYVLFLIVTLSVMYGGCEGIFPAEDKIGPPADHTVSHGGAQHKPGEEQPFAEQSGCSDSDCHHSDLRGGIAETEDGTTIAPSCYQCHGREWDED